MSVFTRLKSVFAKNINVLAPAKGRKALAPADITTLEETLIAADLGTSAARTITQNLAAHWRPAPLTDSAPITDSDDALRLALAAEIAQMLIKAEHALTLPASRPAVILLTGVNGTGKTTSIGKLAHYYKQQGKRVMLAAGDTYRAAALEQLAIWAARVDAPIIAATTPKEDPAALAFRALAQAKAQDYDILIIDTAGRLQNNEALMAELTKIHRVLQKQDSHAPHASLLVLDATTGQNALAQAHAFAAAAHISGLILTKLDSTARGGVIVPIVNALALPIHFIGMGEGIDDLHPFRARDFAAALCDVAPEQIILKEA